MFVFAIHGLQLGEPYSSPARMYVRYRDLCCSRDDPQSLVERHLMMFTLFFPLTTEFCTWEVNLKSLSVVTPRNLYSPTVSMLVLPALDYGFHFLSEEELLNTIALILPSLTFIFHLLAQSKILSISVCMSSRLLPLIFPSFVHVAVSSANKLATVSASRSTSISLMKMRNRSGEMEDPWGSP